MFNTINNVPTLCSKNNVPTPYVMVEKKLLHMIPTYKGYLSNCKLYLSLNHDLFGPT